MIRRLISCTLFVGVGTGLVVGALLVVLPSVRIAGGGAATDGPIVVRAVLVDDIPGGPALAAPEDWRRCPYLAAVAGASRCPYLAAVAAGGGCPYLRGTAGRSTCPFLRSRPGSDANRQPGAGDPSRGRPSDGAVLARLEPTAADQRPAGQI